MHTGKPPRIGMRLDAPRNDVGHARYLVGRLAGPEAYLPSILAMTGAAASMTARWMTK